MSRGVGGGERAGRRRGERGEVEKRMHEEEKWRGERRKEEMRRRGK